MALALILLQNKIYEDSTKNQVSRIRFPNLSNNAAGVGTLDLEVALEEGLPHPPRLHSPPLDCSGTTTPAPEAASVPAAAGVLPSRAHAGNGVSCSICSISEAEKGRFFLYEPIVVIINS